MWVYEYFRIKDYRFLTFYWVVGFLHLIVKVMCVVVPTGDVVRLTLSDLPFRHVWHTMVNMFVKYFIRLHCSPSYLKSPFLSQTFYYSPSIFPSPFKSSIIYTSNRNNATTKIVTHKHGHTYVCVYIYGWT